MMLLRTCLCPPLPCQGRATEKAATTRWKQAITHLAGWMPTNRHREPSTPTATMPRATPLSCAGRPVLALAMALALALPCRAGDVIRVDVLVYGANSAGVGAAVTAAAGGKYKVQVMEPLEMIGGMGAAGGVALMNQGCGLEGVTGLAKNWSLLCGEYYYGTDNPHMVMFPSMNVSEWAFWRLLNSTASISTSVGCRVAAVAKADTGGCVGRVDFLCDNDTRPVSVLATYVIDASYDGDIMVMAGGIDHTHGREGRSVYNESLAGVNLAQPGESFVKDRLDIDPYFPNGTLLPYIDREPLAAPGTGDDKVMAYEYFACVSNTPGNQVPFYAPEGYNADDFTLLLRQTEGVMANGMYPHGPPLDYFGGIQCYDQIVQETTGNRDCLVCCGQGPVDSDQPDLNHGWPTANHSRRQQLRQAHRYYTQGSLYFLANDPRVPNATRESARGYGYCKDEYVKYGNFPPQLYIRISNRLQGKSLLTQNNIANPRVKPDGVAMGCWTFDQHTMSRHAVQDPKNSSRTVVRNEGYFRAPLEGPTRADGRPLGCEEGAECWSGVNWYDVPFGVMVPKDGQASNLLVRMDDWSCVVLAPLVRGVTKTPPHPRATDRRLPSAASLRRVPAARPRRSPSSSALPASPTPARESRTCLWTSAPRQAWPLPSFCNASPWPRAPVPRPRSRAPTSRRCSGSSLTSMRRGFTAPPASHRRPAHRPTRWSARAVPRGTAPTTSPAVSRTSGPSLRWRSTRATPCTATTASGAWRWRARRYFT